MASHTRMSAREEERRLNMRTLLIASAASATAAVVTSQLWVAGTWVAAALTPVIVALVSELLHRPTNVIAERVTSRNAAVLPQATEPGPPPRLEPTLRSAMPAEPESGTVRTEPPVSMYRSGSRPGRGRADAGGPSPAAAPRRRGVALGIVALTAALALAITAIAMTGTELVAGGSIGKGERDTTLFGGGRDEGSPQGATPERQDAPSGNQDGQGGAQPDAGQQPPAEEQPEQGEPPAEESPPTPEAPAPSQP